MKFIWSILPTLIFVSSQTTVAELSSTNHRVKVIYGEDNRKDLYEISDPFILQQASATVALIEKSRITYIDTLTSSLKSETFGEKYVMCKDEPFWDQPMGAICTGFLVNEDTILTAGHCLRTQKQCEQTQFVFDFAMHHENENFDTLKNENIYECGELVYSQVLGDGADFAVVRLKSPVVNRIPLQVNTFKDPQIGDGLYVIGHPVGLPTKFASGAHIRSLHNGYLRANLDTYSGNSGSPVFNESTGLVEGILVRGEVDFSSKNKCLSSNKCKDSECRGEDVTSIHETFSFISY